MRRTHLHDMKTDIKLIKAFNCRGAGGSVVWVMMQFAANDFPTMFYESKIGPPQLKKFQDLPLVTVRPESNC